VKIRRCRRCGRHAFPPPLWCPDCAGDAWDEVEAGPGTVESVTVTREGVRVGTVRLEAGPPVVVRLDDGAEVGARLIL
jgi:uncharacterized OB-fold protein